MKREEQRGRMAVQKKLQFAQGFVADYLNALSSFAVHLHAHGQALSSAQFR
jgi:hypothetical protein